MINIEDQWLLWLYCWCNSYRWKIGQLEVVKQYQVGLTQFPVLNNQYRTDASDLRYKIEYQYYLDDLNHDIRNCLLRKQSDGRTSCFIWIVIMHLNHIIFDRKITTHRISSNFRKFDDLLIIKKDIGIYTKIWNIFTIETNFITTYCPSCGNVGWTRCHLVCDIIAKTFG